jgi:hypothetical protein
MEVENMAKVKSGRVSEMAIVVNGHYPTAIMKYPTGKYGLVGHIPGALYDHERGRSKIWATEQEVIDALLAINVTKFQLADCSWYQV